MSTRPGMVLKKNDRVVFLGDSITEQQLYTNYVESYLATRYPELQLTFFNAGWGGDRAPGGAQRLERDVLSLKPTVVTICYGMNDAAYTRPNPEILKAFTDGMRQLLKKLKSAKVRVVLLTPGFADESVNANLKAVDYNRSGLRRLADAVLALAAKEKLPAYDIHKLMTEVDARAKKAIPGFTFAPDGFHPSPPGHLVMAFGLLQALGVPQLARQIKVDLNKKTVAAPPGIKVKGPKILEAGIALELQLDGLPFYVEPEARKVLPFLPFQETYNDLSLKVEGLKDSSYCFRMEMEKSPAFSPKELAQGVNLYSLFGMPALLQAQAIHQFTFEKCQVYFKLWRMLALGGGNAAYSPAPHKAAIKLLPDLDKTRAKLAAIPPRSITLRLYSSKAKGEPLGNGDFISLWSLLGSFPKPYAKDYLGGEAKFSASVPEKSSAWALDKDLDIKNPGNNLGQIFGNLNDCMAYAVTVLDSPITQSARLLLGSDDGYAVWLNGRQLEDQLELKRGLSIDQNTLPIELKKGKNVLLLKISQDTGSWGFCARLSGLKQDLVADRP